MAVAASLLLLLIANGAPILARQVLGRHWDTPLDGGRVMADGHRLLGPSKTVRGVAAAVAASAAAAAALGYGALPGAAFGALAMVGDAASSFVKRRLGIAPSGMALGLDQIPEALLPVVALRSELDLTWAAVAIVVAGFFILELLLSQVLFRLRVRRRPY